MFDKIFKSKWIPVPLQILTFVVFILLIMSGWSITTNDRQFLLTLRNTNLANLIVWCFWWPVIILLSILFGRLWCIVCPMELIASLLNRVGLKWKTPKFLHSGWAITFLYLVVLIIGVHTLAIHRFPHRMALYMITLFGLSIILSLIFRKRAFCTFFCPVGYQLGLYSTIACTEYRIKNKEVCDACREKPCINKTRDFAWYGRACQSYLFPGTLNDNRDCILCTQCIKACPYDNITFRFRKPFKDLFRGFKLNMPQMTFIMIIFGFTFYEVTTEWKTAGKWLLAPFKALNNLLDIPSSLNGTMTAFLLFFALPVILFIIVSYLHSIVCSNKKGIASLSAYLIAFIPLVASTHFAKALVKSVSRFQYIPGAIKDPKGVETAQAILSGIVHTGGKWQENLNIAAIIFSILVLITGIGITLSLLTSISKKNQDKTPIFYILLSILYFICTSGALLGKMFA